MYRKKNYQYNVRYYPSYSWDSISDIISTDSNIQHYNGHLEKYYENLEKHSLEIKKFLDSNDSSLLTIIKKFYGILEFMNIYNSASQILCHIMFWESLTPDLNKRIISNNMLSIIYSSFPECQTYSDFKNLIINKSKDLFGSGWLWIVQLDDDKIDIMNTPNAFNPINIANIKSILVCIDLWEHAFYLSYKHNKVEFVKKILDGINWDQAENIYKDNLTSKV